MTVQDAENLNQEIKSDQSPADFHDSVKVNRCLKWL